VPGTADKVEETSGSPCKRGSLLCSQEPKSGPYPKLDKSDSHPKILFLRHPFLILPSYNVALKSVYCQTTDWTTGRSGFDSQQGKRISPLTSVSRPALRPTQPPVQRVPGVLYLGEKGGRGVTLTTHPHLVQRSRMSRSYTSSPPRATMVCSGTALLLLRGSTSGSSQRVSSSVFLRLSSFQYSSILVCHRLMSMRYP
jgi:hypothetical protein